MKWERVAYGTAGKCHLVTWMLTYVACHIGRDLGDLGVCLAAGPDDFERWGDRKIML